MSSHIPMRHYLRTLHPILLPNAVLFAAFVALLVNSRDGETRVMLVQMATGQAVLVSVYLLLRQAVGILIMGAQGFDKLRDQVNRLNAIHEREIEQYERHRRDGPETPGPAPRMPDFTP